MRAGLLLILMLGFLPGSVPAADVPRVERVVMVVLENTTAEATAVEPFFK